MEGHSRISVAILSAFATLLTCTLGQPLLPCLTDHGVRNFTTFSSSPSTYNHFLHYSMQNPIFAGPNVLKPFSIVLPESKQQLASAIACAISASLTVRIRSGGHSYEGLSSTATTPFMIIDLMNLNRVSVDIDSQTAWVESGATLGEVYYAVAESTDSFAVTAGWCPTVGIGGHISGGGIGIMTRKYGLASDNVVDAILVDAKGRILDRESMGEDVFWAIRGGGGGVFGAIYAWKIQLVPVPRTVTGFLFKKTLPAADAALLFHRFQYVASQLVEDFTVTILSGSMPDGSLWVQCHGLHLGPKSAAISSGSRVFSELDVPVEKCKEMRWVDAIAYMQGFQNINELKERTVPHKLSFKAKIDFVRKAMPVEGFAGIVERLQKEPRGFIALNGLGGAMERIRSDATPFPHRKGILLVFEHIVAWEMEEDSRSEEFLEWQRELYEYMVQFASNNPRPAYVNHVDFDHGTIDWSNSGDAVETARKWGEKYFMANYDRLVKAKTIIDPDNVFRHPQSIPPLPSLCAGETSDGGDSTIASW